MTTSEAPGAPEAAEQPVEEEPTPGAQVEQQEEQEEQDQPDQRQPDGKATQQEKKNDTQDVSSLPDWAQKLIRNARAEAGKARMRAKEAAAAEARQQLLADISKMLGLSEDAEPTIDDLKQQLEERQQLIDELRANQTEHMYQNFVRSAAGDLGADADALLDSTSFREAVQEELDEEFTDEDLADAVKKVAAVYAKKPRFARPAPAPAESERKAPTPTRPVESLTAGGQPADAKPMDMDAVLRAWAGRT